MGSDLGNKYISILSKKISGFFSYQRSNFVTLLRVRVVVL